jgi:Asp-tRNA(Asn)/Glu-tRNA(Gln) amidotransferase A subunit family amidase
MYRTIRDASVALREGKLTCVELLEMCLTRIDQHDARIRAWVVVDRDGARQAATRADAERKAGLDRGPLHGMPVGIKDIIDVVDLPTACGSKRWQNSIARQDAPCVRRLREAGAVIVGKTATTQFASFDPAPTLNPWDATRTPGGSSSGSAAAVAMGMCLAALASQTGGSITRPASFCGVASIKPTYGRVSTDGVLSLAPSMDHVGAMANCVEDLETVLDAISYPGFYNAPRCNEPIPVIGISRGFFQRYADDAVNRMMATVRETLTKQGVEFVDIDLPASFEEVIPRHRTIMAVEAAAYHQERLARHPDDYGPNITQLVREGIVCPAPEYARSKAHQMRLTEDMQATLSVVEALLCPATTRSAPDAATTGDPAFNSPWSYTGMPVVSLPVMLGDDGLPLGVQLVGPHGAEAQLFAVAAWCERRLPGVGAPPS